MAVYILHFDVPLAHARHYVGWANNVDQRLAHHRDGTGARLTQVLNGLGIGYQLARVFDPADKAFERKLKRTHSTADYCPLCHAVPRDYHPRDGDHPREEHSNV